MEGNLPPSLSFAFLGAFLLVDAFFVFFARLYYKKKKGQAFSFLNGFPFELALDKTVKVFFAIACFFDLFANVHFFVTFSHNPRGLGFLAFALGLCVVIRTLLLMFMVVLPASYNKQHILVVSLYFGFAALVGLLGGFYLFRLSQGGLYPATLVFGILSMMLGVINLFIMANPRFASWAKLASEEEGGEVVVKRPAFFLLAASEWLGILLSVLISVFLSLGVAFLAL